ncbi:MAG: family 43 glycosylhydrolase [Thermoguttaceae bacterium]|nr:family 43 glycosylhydrolase [Thermoguttaceae bacterium]
MRFLTTITVLAAFFAAALPLSAKNPILPGVAADPEILLSENTGKFYIYPTTIKDQFKVFSSDDLVHWQDEGAVLDLKDVSWASSKAWAPSILETKIEGQYRYFFYFCAEEKIGVAVGDSPTGPFVDSGRCFIPTPPEGARGVQIDPDVFTDPKDGKTYLFWGNSYLAVGELADDFISFKPETVRLLDVPGFFEGAHVFERDGIYYLTWSQNPTWSPEYRVLYAMSDSPTGPYRIPENNIILSKRPEKNILGPGHHSVVKLPGTDRWLIFYHRLVTPRADGTWDREVCIDQMRFNPDGTIAVVEPTHEGVESIKR